MKTVFSLTKCGLLVFSLCLFLSAFADERASASYTGAHVCVDCHAEQYALWSGSHHDLAMQPANSQTVLGDFDNATLKYGDVTTTFFIRNGQYMVNTDGLDGKLHDYTIEYTFGVYPLQQYLVDFGKGRLQALAIAWDARPESEGGQRWFSLYPDEQVNHADALHWTRSLYNWNGMCASCHSTNLQKRYDSTNDAFDTQWASMNVSCEACHGPASEHIEWAKQRGSDSNSRNTDYPDAGSPDTGRYKGFKHSMDERKDVLWSWSEGQFTAHRSSQRETEKEIAVCAPCHSRRSEIATGYEPGDALLDFYLPSTLSAPLYYADGQIQDEVYEYGSFLQSKMYQAGVTCSDCHEPHSLQLRQTGNAVCTRCHKAEYYDTPSHHHHKSTSEGAKCAECHMPVRTYMGIDGRHDHSLRLPRADLSEQLGVPNVCNHCHQDKKETGKTAWQAKWALEKMREWYGTIAKGHQQYAMAFAAAERSQQGADQKLRAVIEDVETPEIARATAIQKLSAYLSPRTLELVLQGLKHVDPLVRYASITAAETLPPALLIKYLSPLLTDMTRAVRAEAARVLAAVPAEQFNDEQRVQFEKALGEYVNSQQINADRPQAQANLGIMYQARGDSKKAARAYQKAISLDDSFVPAYINLADIYQAQKDFSKAKKVLHTALDVSSDNAVVWFSLGLLQVRQQQLQQAMLSLRNAAEQDQSNARYIYVYAVALNSSGKNEQAIRVMQQAYKRFPDNSKILQALVAFHRDAGHHAIAQMYMKKLEDMK